MRTEGMKTGRLQLILCPQSTQTLATDSTVLSRPLIPSFGEHSWGWDRLRARHWRCTVISLPPLAKSTCLSSSGPHT